MRRRRRQDGHEDEPEEPSAIHPANGICQGELTGAISAMYCDDDIKAVPKPMRNLWKKLSSQLSRHEVACKDSPPGHKHFHVDSKPLQQTCGNHNGVANEIDSTTTDDICESIEECADKTSYIH